MKDYIRQYTLRMVIPTIIVFGSMLVFSSQVKSHLPKYVDNIPIIEVGEDAGELWLQPVKVKRILTPTSIILEAQGEGEVEVSLTGIETPDRADESLDYITELLPEGVRLYMERVGPYGEKDNECYLWITDEVEEDTEFVRGYMINGILLDEGIVNLADDRSDGKYYKMFKRIDDK